ncbi:MAG TPA: hypothetical protein VH599_04555 [Ktedonobacterales bacterium]|jgi:hypothetical protein
MTGWRFLKHSPQRRASDRLPRYLPSKGRWNAPEPVNLRTNLIIIGFGLALGAGYILELISGRSSEAGLFFLLASALLGLGGFSLFFALGRRLASRLRGVKKHCGCCRFYEVRSGLYVIGRCQADPSRNMVTCADGCRSFRFSERAMVRERLAQHPRILKQLQIICASDATKQS